MVCNAVHNAFLEHFNNGNAVHVRSGSFSTTGSAFLRVPHRNEPGWLRPATTTTTPSNSKLNSSYHFMATIDQSIDWTVLLIALEAMRSCCILSIGSGRHIKLITRLDRPHSPIHSARWWRRWRWCRWVACASTINQASIISLCSRATTPSTPLVRTTLPVNDGACHVVQCCNDRVSLFIYEFKWLTNWCICILAI